MEFQLLMLLPNVLKFSVGVFSFLSYRDPNLFKTLGVYDGTGDFLRQLDMDDETLTKSIIGTIGDVDSYQLPDAKGYSRYVHICQFLVCRRVKIYVRVTVNQKESGRGRKCFSF